MRKSFKLENLDCANCAAKMETGINQLPGVNKASISFMTSKLVIDADTDDAEAFAAIVDAAQQVCTSDAPDCLIKRETRACFRCVRAARGFGVMLDAQFRSERKCPVDTSAERGLSEHRVLPRSLARTARNRTTP